MVCMSDSPIKLLYSNFFVLTGQNLLEATSEASAAHVESENNEESFRQPGDIDFSKTRLAPFIHICQFQRKNKTRQADWMV